MDLYSARQMTLKILQTPKFEMFANTLIYFVKTYKILYCIIIHWDFKLFCFQKN